MSTLTTTSVPPHNATGRGLLYIGSTASRSTSPYGSRVDLTLGGDNHPNRNPSRPPSPCISTRTHSSDLQNSGEGVVLPDGIDELYCIAPNDVVELKYHRFEHYPMEDDDETMMMIEPHQRAFERENVPSGWKAHVCPEGKLYFAHETMRVVTLTNIQIPEYYERIMAAVHELYPRMPENSPEVELLVQCTWADGAPVMGYYFADWENRIIFWLKAVKHTLITKGERRPVSRPHLQLAMHSQFGLHVEMFCAHHVLPLSMVEEVKDSFESGAVDVITSDQSMFSYDAETANRIVRILDRVPRKATVNRHTSWIVGRSYKTLYSDRYLAFYGESGARCSRSDNAFENTGHSHRTPFFFLVSPFLFFMPFVYLKELDAAFVDKTVHYHAWRRFIAVLKRDWENAITPATVLLSANVGFLAIQSIDTSGALGNRSAAQIASYISAILSLFIYIACQILTRRHRHHETEQAERALKFLQTRHERFLGLQAVAMAFSLPIALFIWSMLSFLVAMIFIFFDKTSLATKATLGVTLGVLFIIIMALLYLEWDNAAPMSGFGIFWGELKKYLKMPFTWFKRLSFALRKRPARRDSDVENCAMGDRSGRDVRETRSGSAINIYVESTTAHDSVSEPSIRTVDGIHLVSGQTHVLEKSVSSMSSLGAISTIGSSTSTVLVEGGTPRVSVDQTRELTLPTHVQAG